MKTLRYMFLVAVATVAVLFLWAFFTVASQASDPVSLYHASFADWPSLAVDHIMKNLGVFSRWGVIIFLVFSLITKIVLHVRYPQSSISDADAEVDDHGPRPPTAWEQLSQAKAAKLADPSPVERHRVS